MNKTKKIKTNQNHEGTERSPEMFTLAEKVFYDQEMHT